MDYFKVNGSQGKSRNFLMISQRRIEDVIRAIDVISYLFGVNILLKSNEKIK